MPARSSWAMWKDSVAGGSFSRSAIAPAAKPSGPASTSRRKIASRVSCASAESASTIRVDSIVLEISNYLGADNLTHIDIFKSIDILKAMDVSLQIKALADPARLRIVEFLRRPD